VELRDPVEAKAGEAARRIAGDKGSEAYETMLNELAIGAPPKVQAKLLSGVVERKDPRSLDVLLHYAQNRNVQLRKVAIVGLGAPRDPKVVPALVVALADTASDVRAAAARQLAARKEKSAEVDDALIKLLAHKDEVAVEALGALGGPRTARKLGELIGGT